ncbi:MAG: CotH kinase family protein [Tannerella sp.]|nr:CotH kinase family protein [Tannerella sp.]
MKLYVYLLCLLSVCLWSCKDYDDELSKLEKEIADLNRQLNNQNGDISNLQSVISLQSAYMSGKTIASANRTTVGNSEFLEIKFTDATTVLLPVEVVESLTVSNDEYTIVLKDGQTLKFNVSGDVEVTNVRPEGIVILTQEVRFMKNTEVCVEFRVNPSNAVFNYDVTSPSCQVFLDAALRLPTYSSYVTQPDKFYLSRVEPSRDRNGILKEGQYKAYIKDRGYHEAYKTATTIVISAGVQNDEEVMVSSAAIPIERKKNTGLPVVVINTLNGDEIRDKVTWMAATMKIIGFGDFDDYSGSITIRGRGNSTWVEFPKKPYSIKLDTKSKILGMPEHKRWTLLANYIDRTLIRNYIAFEVARRTGLDWTPRGQFVEVMLNDVHLGNYYLCESIEIDENRINITKMGAEDLDEESITGGYLFEIDNSFDEINKFHSAITNSPIMFKEPDDNVLQPAQFEYAVNYIDSVEKLLYNKDSLASRAYANFLDDTTFIDWWFVYEITGNAEPINPRSCYMYKDRLGLLKMGPVWDFDLATFIPSHTSRFMCTDALWYGRLFRDPVFVNKAKERWKRFKPAFDEVATLIETESNKLILSEELNNELWTYYSRVYTNEEEEKLTYPEAIANMKYFYRTRLSWLNEKILSWYVSP